MEEFNEELANSKVSKINAAALINLIIAKLWEDSHRNSRTGDLSKWNADLNCIWVELAGDVESESDQENEFKKIETEIVNSGSLSKKKATGFEQVTDNEILRHAKQHNLLMKKAVFLKRLQNAQGKGTAYQDNADDYMD